MWTWLHKAGSPKTTYRLIQRLQPWLALAAVLLIAYGVYDGLAVSPADYQQGNAFRIIYIHVPAAILSMMCYSVMAVAAFIYLVWKIKVADMVAKVSAPLGVLFTVMTLVAGSIWGRPMWGAWWIWDARLTSELILLFIYLGIIGLRSTMPDAQYGAKASCSLILIGAVNLPIIHYSVDWWHTLHQGATILKWGAPSIVPSMLHPLLLLIAGGICYYAWMLCLLLKHELLQRESSKQWVKQLLVEVA